MSDSNDVDSGTGPINLLRTVRRELGVRVKELSERTGYTEDQIYNAESGRTEPNARDLLRFASALGVPPSRLLPGPQRLVEVGGWIEGGYATLGERPDIDDVGTPPPVEVPDYLNPAAVVALDVYDQSLFPLERGSIVFFEKPRPGVPPYYIGRLVMVRQPQLWLVGQLRAGRSAGTFSLLSPWRQPIDDIMVEESARVVGIVPPPTEGDIVEDFDDAPEAPARTLHENVEPFRPRRPRRS